MLTMTVLSSSRGAYGRSGSRKTPSTKGFGSFLEGKLGSAKLAVQVDVGFGDSVIPPPLTIEFPTLLAFPAPTIRAYAKETTVAEKLHAMVSLGMANSRMKDFFDIWFLCREFEFQGQPLVDAVRATFDRRQTPIPGKPPVALTNAFASDGGKQTQWSAFLDRSRVVDKAVTLPEVVRTIAPFLGPVAEAAAGRVLTPATWMPSGPWALR